MQPCRAGCRGYSLIEFLIVALIGSFAALLVVNLMFSGSKALKAGQDHASLLPKLQTAMGHIVRDIRSANTSNPPAAAGLGTLLPINLPLLPYEKVEGSPLLDSLAQYPFPASPAARMFPSQSLVADKWRPEPANQQESNSLVFYRSQGGVLHRISLVNRHGELVREDQSPVTSANNRTDTPVPVRQTLMENLVAVQFTYPLLDAVSTNPAAGLGSTEKNLLLNSRYRTLIAIKLIAQVPGSGKPLELSEQVEVRN